ncbi:hypothetical protein [Burkholderia anthina]|uniref:hypothetical protein n=1 Tax=Burkholderia anthina TaxID=179879 RepID=UPI0037BE37B3
MTVFKFQHYDTTQYLKCASQGWVSTGCPNQVSPGAPGDIEYGIVRPVNTAMGNFLVNAEALLADRLKRVSPDDIAHQSSPPLHPQHGAHHHE